MKCVVIKNRTMLAIFSKEHYAGNLDSSIREYGKKEDKI